MQNILICIATNKFFNGKYIKQLCSEIDDDVNCYVIVGYWWEIGLFDKDYFCFSRDDCIVGDFSKYVESLDLKRGVFLDSKLVEDCEKFIYEALMIQRRFEYKYPYFMSNDLKKHAQLVVEQIDFWNSFIEQRGINRVILSDVPHDNYEYIIYKLCEIKRIDTHIIKNVFKTNNYFLLKNYKDINDQICRGDYCEVPIKDVFLDEDFKSLFESIDGSANSDFLFFKNETSRRKEFNSRIGTVNPIKFLIETVWKNAEKRQNDFGLNDRGIKKLTIPILIKSVLQALMRMDYYIFILYKWISTKIFVHKYRRLSSNPISGEKYIYFSMHAEPEAALNPMGGWLGNQYVPIKLLSESIPDDWYLYVKIHPAQVDVMLSIDDFIRLKSIKNIRIISDRVRQSYLIKNSLAVATLSGEVGLEANFYNKPCFNLGYTYYSDAPTSIRVDSVDDIKKAIQDINAGNISCNKDDIKKYLFRLQNESLKGMDTVIKEMIKRINLDM